MRNELIAFNNRNIFHDGNNVRRHRGSFCCLTLGFNLQRNFHFVEHHDSEKLIIVMCIAGL